MKPIDDSKLREQNAKLELEFKNERTSWGEKVADLIGMIKHSDKLTEAMAYGLSYRQIIIETLAQYKQLLAKKQSNMDVLRAERYRTYMLEGDLKLTGSEKNDAVNADLTSIKYQISLLQIQIDFLSDTIQTLSSFQFAVKNKITIITEEIM